MAVRPWTCLAAANATFGSALADTCDSTPPRQPRIHLTHERRAAAAPITTARIPSALSATVSGHTVVFSWAAPGTADAPASYVFEAGSASGRTDLANADVGSAASTLTALDVPSGSYVVRVRARYANATSAPSNEIAVIVAAADSCAAAPSAPVNLSASASGGSVTLTWQAPASGCAPTAYQIEAGSAPGLSDLANFSTGSTATTFGASGVGSGTYFVRVRALTAGGASAASNEARLVVGSTACTGAPAAPGGFTSTVNGTTVVLSWTASAGSVSSYVIEAGSAPGLTDLVVSDTGSTATSLTATAGAGTYYVRLRARSACGTSAPSAEITVVVGGTGSDGFSIFVSDMWGQRLVRVTDFTGANWATGPTSANGSLSSPWHFSFDARGRIYVADRDNNRIVRMDDLNGNGWTTFSGVGTNTLADPNCLAANPGVGCVDSVTIGPDGRIYIANAGKIVRIDDMNGTGYTIIGIPGGPGALGFQNPKVLMFDALGRMYVTDTDNGRIARFNDTKGTGWVTFGSPGTGVGQFNRPEGLAIDSLGRIYVTDNENHRIVRINDMTGAGWVTFGSHGSIAPTGPVTSPAVGQFEEPHDLVLDSANRIYIADTGNNRIVRINDMSGAGWITFGNRAIQYLPPNPACPGGNCTPPGYLEFLTIKGIRLPRP